MTRSSSSLPADAKKWVVCSMAAVFHTCAFLQATRCFVLAVSGCPIDVGLDQITILSLSCVVAYCWDLAAISFLGIVPLSRCRWPGMDVVGHHLPVLLLMIPFGAPYIQGWASEPATLIPDRHRYLLFCDGLAFMSSLNEAIMCWQSVGPVQPLFRSRAIVAFELAFKVLIFTVMASGTCVGCLTVDWQVWALCRGAHPASLADAVAATLRSPIVIRTVAYLAFVATKYPPMAQRAIKKLRSHIEHDDGAPPVDWRDAPKRA